MKPIKITTREDDKRRERIKYLTEEIDILKRAGAEFPKWAHDSLDKLHAERDATRAPHIEAAENLLASANGKATAHTLTRFSEVERIAREAEERLDATSLPLGERAGIEVSFIPAGPSANAYKYEATTTRIELLRVADGWRLVGAARASVRPKQAERFDIPLSEAQRDRVAKIALAPFGTIPDHA